ncbi:glycosyltransferase family 4 protein [Prochlorococcus sp. AH-716-N03]|nr:glycosyltransferase family 4 protein [Prochlorococcus sp. AH-716-N03]
MQVTFLDQYSYLGGGQIILISLIKSLKKTNNINVIFPKGGSLEKKIKNLENENICLYGINENDFKYEKKNILSTLRLIKNNFSVFGKYFHVIKSSDLIYCNAPRLFLICVVASIFLNKKINYHIHSKYNLVESILISFISQLKYTNKVIFCSNFVFKNFKKNILPLNLKKISIIENGLSEEFDIEKFKNRFNHGKYKGFLKFAIIGSLKPEKGQDIVLSLGKSFPNIEFYIVGRESLENKEWIAYLKNKSNSNIFFQNEIIDIKKFIGDNFINIFLVPSKWDEPFGLVAIEGMSLSCITIVSNKGGLIDIAKKTGAFIYSNENELNKIIRYLYSCDKKKLIEIAQNQFISTKKIYSFRNFSNKIKNIIYK